MALTLLEPQSCFGDKPLNFQVVCPQNGTAVLKGYKTPPEFTFFFFFVPWWGGSTDGIKKPMLQRSLRPPGDETACFLELFVCVGIVRATPLTHLDLGQAALLARGGLHDGGD